MGKRQRQEVVNAREGKKSKSSKRRSYKSTGELKGVDTSCSIGYGSVVSTQTTNDAIIPINLIEEGSASYNRIGRKIHSHSVRITGGIDWKVAPQTNFMNGTYVRMILVWDKQPSGSLPVFSDIFGNTDATGTEAVTMFDNLRYDNTDRFRVLKDKTYTLNAPVRNQNASTGTAYYATLYKKFDWFVKLKGKETAYKSSTSPPAISDISSGGLYFIVRASANSSGTNEVAISACRARLRYTDQ